MPSPSQDQDGIVRRDASSFVYVSCISLLQILRTKTIAIPIYHTVRPKCLGIRDEVYGYSTRLIRELGPEGFILQSGCDIAPNARLENIRAMVAAATGK
jgi:hypothetical protein